MSRSGEILLTLAAVALAASVAGATTVMRSAPAGEPSVGDTVKPASESPETALRLQEEKIENLQTAYDKALEYDNLPQAKELQRKLNAAQLQYHKMLERHAAQSAHPAKAPPPKPARPPKVVPPSNQP